MPKNRARRRPSHDQLKAWLEQVLVPVEPSPRFLKRLRGRLVSYQGKRMPSIWMLVSVLAMMLVMVAGSLYLTLRIVLGLINLVGSIKRRRGRARTERMASAA